MFGIVYIMVLFTFFTIPVYYYVPFESNLFENKNPVAVTECPVYALGALNQELGLDAALTKQDKCFCRGCVL